MAPWPLGRGRKARRDRVTEAVFARLQELEDMGVDTGVWSSGTVTVDGQEYRYESRKLPARKAGEGGA